MHHASYLLADFYLTHLLMSMHLQSVPVSADAGHAEAVAAWCRRRVSEHIEADGALELLFRQKATI